MPVEVRISVYVPSLSPLLTAGENTTRTAPAWSEGSHQLAEVPCELG